MSLTERVTFITEELSSCVAPLVNVNVSEEFAPACRISEDTRRVGAETVSEKDNVSTVRFISRLNPSSTGGMVLATTSLACWADWFEMGIIQFPAISWTR